MRAVIFDLDGTLIDSRTDILAAFSSAFEGLGREVPPPDLLLRTIGMRLEDCFLPFVEKDASEADRAAALFRRWYETHFLDSTRPFRGVEGMLARLSIRFPLAVCTMKKAFFARKIVSAFKWDSIFSAVVGSEEGFPPKPDPAMLLEICRRMRVEPGHAVYVGDTHMDGRTAFAAGMPFCFAGYGYGKLDGPGPVRIWKSAESPEDVAALFN